jgi:hypothetical protein
MLKSFIPPLAKIANKKIITILILISSISPISLFSETILLKSGKTIEKKIFAITDTGVIVYIDKEGALTEYPYSEISLINDKKPKQFLKFQKNKKLVLKSIVIFSIIFLGVWLSCKLMKDPCDEDTTPPEPPGHRG